MARTHMPHGSEEARREETARLKEKALHAGSALAEGAKDMSSSALETAKETAASVAGTVGEWAATAGSTVGDAVSAVGSGMESLGGTIRDSAPREGMLGTAASSVASTLESGGKYLREEGLSGAAAELGQFIRRNPIPAVLIGFGLGFLLARATRS